MNRSEKPFGKKSDPKIEKTVEIKVKLQDINKKLPARKRLFVQTPFSNSTLKLERKISHRKTNHFLAPFHVRELPKSLLQFDFKNHENVETDLKKKHRQKNSGNDSKCNPILRHSTTYQTKGASTKL